MELLETGWTDNNRSVCLLCLYLFEYQDAFQMNTNIRIIRIMGIQMRTLIDTDKFIRIFVDEIVLLDKDKINQADDFLYVWGEGQVLEGGKIGFERKWMSLKMTWMKKRSARSKRRRQNKSHRYKSRGERGNGEDKQYDKSHLVVLMSQKEGGQKALLIFIPPIPTRHQVTLVRTNGRGSLRNVQPVTTMEESYDKKTKIENA